VPSGSRHRGPVARAGATGAVPVPRHRPVSEASACCWVKSGMRSVAGPSRCMSIRGVCARSGLLRFSSAIRRSRDIRWCKTRQLAREYDEADCKILPSMEEGFAVAVATGWAGMPAIVRRHAGGGAHEAERRDGNRRGTESCGRPPRTTREAATIVRPSSAMGPLPLTQPLHPPTPTHTPTPNAAFETCKAPSLSRASSTKWGDVVARFSRGGVLMDAAMAADAHGSDRGSFVLRGDLAA